MTKELKEQIHERIYNLKVPTLGFSRQDLFDIAMEYVEPREKLIEELEQKLEQTEKDLVDYQFNYPTIKELQKENAELKEQHEVSARNMSSFIESLSKSENEAKKQLTKAKELLKQWLQTTKASSCDNINIVTDTEQFIGEVEK